MTHRTSITDPLRIAMVSSEPHASGSIGLTLCPGKGGVSIYGVNWRRDLATDLDVIEAWGAAVVITLLELKEIELLGVQALGHQVRGRGMTWMHLPIQDLHVPNAGFGGLWEAGGSTAVEALAAGKRVLVHCRGGLGRAGTVASMLLVELGAANEEALRRVRKARPGAVETSAQERFVSGFKPQLAVKGA